MICAYYFERPIMIYLASTLLNNCLSGFDLNLRPNPFTYLASDLLVTMNSQYEYSGAFIFQLSTIHLISKSSEYLNYSFLTAFYSHLYE